MVLFLGWSLSDMAHEKGQKVYDYDASLFYSLYNSSVLVNLHYDVKISQPGRVNVRVLFSLASIPFYLFFSYLQSLHRPLAANLTFGE